MGGSSTRRDRHCALWRRPNDRCSCRRRRSALPMAGCQTKGSTRIIQCRCAKEVRASPGHYTYLWIRILVLGGDVPTPDHLYLGWKALDLATLVALIAGPVVAVVITLWREDRRHRRQQQIQTMRMLVSTRHLAGDPAYSQAINLIPIEFNRQAAIMKAWREYIEVVRFNPLPDNEQRHLALTVSKQTALVFVVLQYLGYGLSETDIQTSAYAAGGLIERDNLAIDAQRAWRDIATALQTQNRLTAAMINPPPPDQPALSG